MFRSVSKIHLNQIESFELGNLDSMRDWGHAKVKNGMVAVAGEEGACVGPAGHFKTSRQLEEATISDFVRIENTTLYIEKTNFVKR